ncbi:MAG: tetratricopeptide repeat protein [Myxococcota bacterium]
MSAALKSTGPARRGWLFGPASDLLFGCGLAYLAVFALHCAAGPALRDWVPLAVLPVATLLLSTPHYGATLIRVYEDTQERRIHALTAIWATAGLCAAFWLGLQSVAVGSLFVTLYLTWSPWHYTAQNFGVAMVLLRRRGAAPSALASRLLRASFYCSFFLAFVSLHGQATPPYSPDGITGYGYYVRTLGIPPLLRDAALAGGALVWVALSGSAAVLLVRGARGRAVAPALLVMCSQTVWFVVPALARNWQVAQGLEPLGLAQAQYAFLWIALAHAVQYLWITSSYQEARERDFSLTRYYGRALAAGATAWTVPALLFAPGILGKLPFDAGLGMLVAALVNLHHFMLDGVIWKLRDRRVARVLLSDSGAPAEPLASGRRSAPIRWLVGALGTASVAVSLLGVFETNLGVAAGFDRGDVSRLELADRRLRWIGRASPEVRLRIGLLEMRQGRLDAAERDLDQSLALHPTAATWIAKGYLAAQRADFSEALSRYDRGLSLDARNVEALNQSAYALLQLGRRDEAVERLRRAVALDPGNAKARELLESAR